MRADGPIAECVGCSMKLLTLRPWAGKDQAHDSMGGMFRSAENGANKLFFGFTPGWESLARGIKVVGRARGVLCRRRRMTLFVGRRLAALARSAASHDVSSISWDQLPRCGEARIVGGSGRTPAAAPLLMVESSSEETGQEIKDLQPSLLAAFLSECFFNCPMYVSKTLWPVA